MYKNYKKNRKIIEFKKLIYDDNFKNKSVYIAIIIPHRNRLDHLIKFVNHLDKLDVYKNKIDIFVIDQNNGDKFNKGILFNVGFILSLKKNNYDRYIFHDVDSYPDQYLLDQYFQNLSCNIHFASPDLKYKYNFYTFFGGVVAFTKNDFKLINGFPNNFFGWGGEDDAIYNRVAINNIDIYRPLEGSYILEDHPPPQETEYNKQKQDNILYDLKNWYKNGLSQIINIFINMKEYNNLEEFIDKYFSENSNITNDSIILDIFLKNIKFNDNKNKKIQYYFYKLDYLAKHKYNNDILLDKNFINIQIENKIKDLKLKYKEIYQNKKNPTYISVIQPLIDWSEIEENIINTYTEPVKFNLKKNINNFENNIKELISKYFDNYNKSLSKEDLFKTIKFIFDNYNELLFFRIRNNKIVCAFHLYNPKNKKDWYKYLEFINESKTNDIDNSYKYLIEKQNKQYYTLRKPHFIPANNCLLGFDSYNYFEGNPISYVQEFKNMLEFTINKFKDVPDCDILINRKDFAYLRKDKTFSYNHLGSNKELKIDENIDKLWFVGSQSITIDNLDIPIPSADEWNDCQKNIKLVDWNDKIPKAVFRGSSTGCGYDIKNNPRLRLSDISYKWNNDASKKNLIDVSISKITSRIKVYNKLLGIIDFKKYKYLLGSFLNFDDQLKYKYIFNIEGNAQAYRYPNEFKKKSVIINVKSKYFMWFEPLLENNKNIITVENDYSDLYDKLIYLKNNDDVAEKIATNGYEFSKKFINHDSISTYWFYYMLFSNKNIK